LAARGAGKAVSALEPKLTVYDRRVLMAVLDGDGIRPRTIWEIAEALNTVELTGLGHVLRGLEHFGYVVCVRNAKRARMVWRRTQRGDGVL
jgi:hypothetical protein